MGSFTRLVNGGRTPEEIVLTFGLTKLQVKRTLPLGNLLPRIRTLYRRGELDLTTVRHLTLASKAQQREWLALLEAGTALVEVLGTLFGTDLGTVWQPDDALLNLIKDREVLDRILAEVADDMVAQANAGATGKVKRGIIRDCPRGEGGRAKVDG